MYSYDMWPKTRLYQLYGTLKTELKNTYLVGGTSFLLVLEPCEYPQTSANDLIYCVTGKVKRNVWLPLKNERDLNKWDVCAHKKWKVDITWGFFILRRGVTLWIFVQVGLSKAPCLQMSFSVTHFSAQEAHTVEPAADTGKQRSTKDAAWVSFKH